MSSAWKSTGRRTWRSGLDSSQSGIASESLRCFSARSTVMVTMPSTGQSSLKEGELGDFSEARDLIPAMAAIEPLILQDRAANVINSVALERLAKKGYAIFQACRAIRTEKGWRRPEDAKKDWRSKVDFVIWKRLDPSRLHDDEQVFVNRHVEDEVRAEMDRDAQLLRARQKLEERGGSSDGL